MNACKNRCLNVGRMNAKEITKYGLSRKESNLYVPFFRFLPRDRFIDRLAWIFDKYMSHLQSFIVIQLDFN